MPSPAADPSFTAGAGSGSCSSDSASASISLSRPNFRQVGLRPSGGKLVRGHCVPLSLSESSLTGSTLPSGPSLYAASIPSKFETLLNPQAHTHADGFHSRTARFTPHTSEGPAVGQYDGAHASQLLKQKESWSKKGLGGFVSKDARFRESRGSRLGPGAYNPVSGRYDFNRTDTSAVFKAPPSSSSSSSSSSWSSSSSTAPTSRLSQTHADATLLTAHPVQTTPEVGPGAYDPHVKQQIIHQAPTHQGKPNIWEQVSSGHSHSHSQPTLFTRSNQSFLSTSKRFQQQTPQAPPPGLYNPEPISTTAQRPYTSTFQSKTKRPTMERNARIPGPGFYTADLGSQVVQQQPAAHRTFRVTNLDRFGRPLQRRTVEEVLPGPGHYVTEGPRASELARSRTLGPASDTRSSSLAPPSGFHVTRGGAGIALNSPTRHAHISTPTTTATTTATASLTSTAAALSAQQKAVIATSQIRPPGPAYYNPDPHHQDKRSFHLNAQRKWM